MTKVATSGERVTQMYLCVYTLRVENTILCTPYKLGFEETSLYTGINCEGDNINQSFLGNSCSNILFLR